MQVTQRQSVQVDWRLTLSLLWFCGEVGVKLRTRVEYFYVIQKQERMPNSNSSIPKATGSSLEL